MTCYLTVLSDDEGQTKVTLPPLLSVVRCFRFVELKTQPSTHVKMNQNVTVTVNLSSVVLLLLV